jgi:hypothetical protein
MKPTFLFFSGKVGFILNHHHIFAYPAPVFCQSKYVFWHYYCTISSLKIRHSDLLKNEEIYNPRQKTIY